MVIVCVITCVYLWETQTYKQLAEKHRHITSAIEMDVFLGFLPFFNFNMKRRAIILKKSKGRRNPIVNFICLSFSSQFYWDIKKTAHMQCIHSDEFGNTQMLVFFFFFFTYTNIESLCCTPVNYIMLYVNYITIFKKWESSVAFMQ